MDSEYYRPEDVERFLEHFPPRSDRTLQVLKGHLLIEERLRDALRLTQRNPGAIDKESPNFLSSYQVICLLEAALPPHEDIEYFWSATKKLNSLRNELAHRLEPKSVDDRLRDITRLVSAGFPELPIKAVKGDGIDLDEVTMTMVHLHSMASTLAVVASKLKK